MALSNKCEACSVSVHLSPEIIQKMFENVVDGNVKTVSDKEFSRRMDICMNCESLMYKTTCRYCGCIIQIKAKLESAVCPYPYQSKW